MTSLSGHCQSPQRSLYSERQLPERWTQRIWAPLRPARAIPTDRHPLRRAGRDLPQRDLPCPDLRLDKVDASRPLSDFILHW